MNERIRELAMQTDRECEHLGQSDIGEDWVAKFAELIVKECIAMSTGQNQYKLGFQLAKDFSNHFGVK